MGLTKYNLLQSNPEWLICKIIINNNDYSPWHRNSLECEEQRRCLLQDDLKALQNQSALCLTSIEAILKLKQKDGNIQDIVSELEHIHNLLNGAGIEIENTVTSVGSHKLIQLQRRLAIQVNYINRFIQKSWNSKLIDYCISRPQLRGCIRLSDSQHWRFFWGLAHLISDVGHLGKKTESHFHYQVQSRMYNLDTILANMVVLAINLLWSAPGTMKFRRSTKSRSETDLLTLKYVLLWYECAKMNVQMLLCCCIQFDSCCRLMSVLDGLTDHREPEYYKLVGRSITDPGNTANVPTKKQE